MTYTVRQENATASFMRLVRRLNILQWKSGRPPSFKLKEVLSVIPPAHQNNSRERSVETWAWLNAHPTLLLHTECTVHNQLDCAMTHNVLQRPYFAHSHFICIYLFSSFFFIVSLSAG